MPAFFTAPSIAWGAGAIEQLSGLGARRAFVLVDPGLAGHEVPRRVVEELGKSDATVETSDAERAPDRLEAVGALAGRIRRAAPEWIVAVGGGRTIDAAKAARAVVERPELGLDPAPALLELPDPPRTRLVAIPTTSGSGAEATWTADLLDAEERPVELAGRALVPAWALVDAGSARSLPPAELLTGALETAAQAAEAYLSAWANPFSDALALDALATVVRRLPRAVRWSDDPEARDALHYAATGAGLAASNAQRGLAHALARALVGPSGLPYGRLTGLLLPHVLEFDRPACRERLATVEAALAAGEEGPHLPLPQRLLRLFEVVRAPGDLATAGAALDRIEGHRAEIVRRTLASPGALANPRVPTAADVETVLAAATGRARA